MLRAPERVETARLVLSAPEPGDAAEVFERYAADPDVTLYLGWPTHRTVADTDGFLSFAAVQWERDGMGAYLIRHRETGRLIGSTGLGLEETREDQAGRRAVTGYVLAKDAWNLGYATEALNAMVSVAAVVGVPTLIALCHPQHAASVRVLEKCGFERDHEWSTQMEFPNLAPGVLQETWRFTRGPRRV